MREGYKNSPLGEIPESWEVRRLGELLIRPPEYGAGSSAVGYSNETYRYIRITDIHENGQLINNSIAGINRLKGENYLLRDKDILIARTGNTVGKSYIHKVKNGECAFAGYLIRFVINENNFNPFFLFQFLHSSLYYKWVINTLRTGAQPNINSQEYQTMPITYPSLPEQQKIAEILNTVDDKIEIIQTQTENTQQLKKGLMQRLLTRGIGHTRFKDSALGEIPESWEIVKVSDVCEVKGRIGFRGYTKEDLVKEGFGSLTIGAKHINSNNALDFHDPEYIHWNKYHESPEIQVNIGDVLLVQRGSIGKTAIVNELPEKATINPSMVLLKNISCKPKFFYYFLTGSYIQGYYKKIITSTAVPMISQDQIKKLNVLYPPLIEQQKIAEILSGVDKKLDGLQNKKNHFEQLKKGLMQKLLTGKIRVNTDA